MKGGAAVIASEDRLDHEAAGDVGADRGGIEQRAGADRADRLRYLEQGSAAQARAKRAVDALWPGGPPVQAELPNKQLVASVEDKLEELGLPSVSETTILRAAGRRK